MYGRREHRYLDLVRRFPLRPLRSAADLDAAVAVVDELLDRADLSDPEQDYLDVLSDQIEAYEAGAVPIRPVEQLVHDRDGRVQVGGGAERAQGEPADQVQVPLPRRPYTARVEVVR